MQDTSRIVSIGGAVTEILYALGLDKNIVGVDTTSVYPPRAAGEKTNVGYMRQLSAEGVLGLPLPDPRQRRRRAEGDDHGAQERRMPMVVVPDLFTGEGIVEKIALIASATDADSRGRCLIERVAGRSHSAWRRCRAASPSPSG